MTFDSLELHHLSKRFGKDGFLALNNIHASIPAGAICGVLGPDGAGKTTLLRLMAGLMTPSEGEVLIQGQTGAGSKQSFVGYMPQKFGLYDDLSVQDNLQLHARLRGVDGPAQKTMFERLLDFTALRPFSSRLAGKLSGGMKQKLGLACALVGTPRLLLLDEPGVGVDPLSRRELWKMVTDLAKDGMTVIWSTAYMDEAERCDPILVLDSGRLLHAGSPQSFLGRVQGRTFIWRPDKALPPQKKDDKTPSELLPAQEDRAETIRQARERWANMPEIMDTQVFGNSIRLLLRAGAKAEKSFEPVVARLEDAYMDAVGGASARPSPFAEFPPVWNSTLNHEAVIRAQGLSKHYGSFIAADNISFDVPPGKIFGLLGPNGAGKSTTFRMLCGLSRPTKGECSVAGVDMLSSSSLARSRLGYMAQKFSLYGDLTVEQNIRLFADLYAIPRHLAHDRMHTLMDEFRLTDYMRHAAQDLPLGQKQSLALICAALHGPSALFLDEPTSGVDPRSRREFWKHIQALTDIGVAVLVTTHFMEEAEYCDEVALVYRGAIIARGTPASLRQSVRSTERTNPTLEDAFIACIEAYDAKGKE